MTKRKPLIILVVLLALVQGVMAQGGGANYPTYSFWSNWKVGGELTYNHQYANGGLFDWGLATDLGFGIVGEKEINHIWDLRLQVAFPGVFSDESKVVNGKFFDRYGKYTANFKLSINDLFKGYDPERRFSVYALGGAGFSSNFRIKDFGYWSVMWQGGLGASYDFGKHGSVYAEYLVDNIANIPKFGHLHDLHGLLSVGLMYRFRLTDDDRSKADRSGQTSQKDYEVLSKRIIELENQLASGKKEEKADDKIEEAINGISLILDDSVSFSALPFSVLFAFDSYVITREQMEKVDAVAKLMWENPEICLAVVGYCSYTESKDYNHQLSESRAEAVKNELVRQGIHENRIITSGKGHSMLFGKSRSGVNRRVSFYRILH